MPGCWRGCRWSTPSACTRWWCPPPRSAPASDKELDRLTRQVVAVKNRVQALDRFAWPGLDELVFPDPFTPAARWFRQQVVQASTTTLRQQWQASQTDPADPGDWIADLVAVAEQVVALFGNLRGLISTLAALPESGSCECAAGLIPHCRQLVNALRQSVWATAWLNCYPCCNPQSYGMSGESHGTRYSSGSS